ncbi:protein lifeguard 2-like [Lampetra fluviatilis]
MSEPSAPSGYYGTNQPSYPPPYQPYPNPGQDPPGGYPPSYGGQPGGYPPAGGYPPPGGQPGGYPPAGGYPPPGGQPGGYPPAGGYPPPGGQPGGYPGENPPPNASQPQRGGTAPPPFMMPTIPLHPSFGNVGPSTGGPEYGGVSTNENSIGVWDDKNVRRMFIQKVYIILFVQLLVTFGFVAVCTFVVPVKKFVQNNPAIYWASYGVFFATYLGLVCCTKARRLFPLNFILLAVLTLAMSYLTGMLASFYNTNSVLMCIGVTAAVCGAVTLFCFQTKVDFTSCPGVMFALSMVLLLTGLIAAFTVPFGYIPWIQTVYAGLGAVIFTVFLAVDTQLLLGNRRNSISPEEHINGALRLYMDIVYIFTFLLQLIGSRN